jgi:hypothetical protein
LLCLSFAPPFRTLHGRSRQALKAGTTAPCFVLNDPDGKNSEIVRGDQLVDLRFDDSKSRHRLVVETTSSVVPNVSLESFWESDILDRIYKALAKMRWNSLTTPLGKICSKRPAVSAIANSASCSRFGACVARPTTGGAAACSMRARAL